MVDWFLLQIYYRDKGSRPTTRPQAVNDKFDEFAQIMLQKLRGFEQQCRSFHEASISGSIYSHRLFLSLIDQYL